MDKSTFNIFSKEPNSLEAKKFDILFICLTFQVNKGTSRFLTFPFSNNNYNFLVLKIFSEYEFYLITL